jgi:eukaryotic-like serine/threonine-protein kinase
MTPERWRQVDALFDAALRVGRSERENWLRGACGGDEDMLIRLRRLLEQDERAEHVGFLEPPDAPYDRRDRTATWSAGSGVDHPGLCDLGL